MREYVVSDETLRDLPYEINLKGREVVRCEECDQCSEEGIYTPAYFCLRHSPLCGVPTNPHGFCAWGKRRER